MARAKRADLEDLADAGTEIRSLIEELLVRYGENDEIAGELHQLDHYAQIFIRKGERLPRLRDFHGYKFAIIDEDTGEVRTASHDEAMRLIMGYKTGNVIDIYREWTVINGQWVKRPRTNPDGSTVEQSSVRNFIS